MCHYVDENGDDGIVVVVVLLERMFETEEVAGDDDASPVSAVGWGDGGEQVEQQEREGTTHHLGWIRRLSCLDQTTRHSVEKMVKQ